jgi:hypothetical protein
MATLFFGRIVFYAARQHLSIVIASFSAGYYRIYDKRYNIQPVRVIEALDFFDYQGHSGQKHAMRKL